MVELWSHQKYAVEKYKDEPFFGLLFDMGLGKTMTAARIAEAKGMDVLVIAPNVLCGQWEKELSDRGEERITEKDWDVAVCTSRTKKTKRFKEALERLCGDE